MKSRSAINVTSKFEDRRQVLGWVHLISGLTLMFFVSLHLIEGCCVPLLSVEALLSVVMMFSYWKIRQGISLAIVENTLMASGLVLFSSLVLLESIENSGIFWLAGFPFVAYLVQQVKKARYWVALLIVELAAATLLQWVGWIDTSYSAMQLFQICTVISFFWVFAHIYQSQLEWRKQQLEESYRSLARQQNRMQVILDHSPIGIWMVEDRKIQFLNKAWVKICGTSELEAQAADDYTSLLPDDMVEKALASDEACLQGDQAFYGRDQMICADGDMRTFDFIKVRLAHDNGQESGLVGFAIDVTEKLAAEAEQKLLEQQVQHSQRLESLGVMAGGVAHDFNNLLTVIQGNVELARLEEGLSESMVESLSCVNSAAHAATDLCRQMLDYSGKGVMQSEPLNIQDLIEETLTLLDASKSKNVTLSCHVDSKPPWILADRAQIRQVLLNLVINASEAIGTTKAGAIHISIAHRNLDRANAERFSDIDLKPGPYAVLVVKDDGIGMDAKTIARMFDPFFTTKFTGRGLGMSALLGILRAHDAGMEIKSTPGVGTEISIWFPEIDSVAYGHLVHRHDMKRTLSGRVLVIDDEATVIQVASRMLVHLGLTVTAASSGAEALTLFEQDGDFDWVLLDVTMPEMSGVECLQQLREIRPDIYVIMSSGFDAESAISAKNGCQPNDFLSKPFTLEGLRAAVAKVTD